MTIPSAVLQGPEADNRLAELGLEQSTLCASLAYGYGYAATCTGHHPLTLPGTMAWGFAIAALRDRLVYEDWKIGRFNNFETVIHPSGTHAVAVTSGDAHAGDPISTPRTRYRKGQAMELVVSGNLQMSLAAVAHDDALVPEEANPVSMRTWLLLHYYDRIAEAVQAELSLPSFIENGWVTGWAERIMVDPVPFSTGFDLPAEHDDLEDGIDIDINRRSS